MTKRMEVFPGEKHHGIALSQSVVVLFFCYEALPKNISCD